MKFNFRYSSRALAWAILTVGIIALYPFQSCVEKSWQLDFRDEQGQPIADVNCYQSWQHWSLEESGSHEERFSDESGRVVFPERTIRACLLARIIGPVTQFLHFGPNASYGPQSYILVRKNGFENHAALDNTQGDVGIGGGFISAHVVLKREHRFISPDKQFSIIFPDEWECRTDVPGCIVIASRTSKSVATIRVAAEDLASEVAPGVYAKQQSARLESLRGFVNEGFGGFTRLNDVDAHWMSYLYYDDKGMRLKAHVFYVMKGKRAYTITGIAPEDAFILYDVKIQKVAESFRLEPAK